MANRLIDELIINVRTRGHREASRNLQRLQEQAEGLENVELNLNVPRALIATLEQTNDLLLRIDSSIGNLNNNSVRSFRNLERAIDDVGDEVTGLARGYQDLERGAGRVQRGLAGVNRQGRNQARTFSDISGAGGFVSTQYAAIAANVFALSESFRLLSEAADVSRLQSVSGVLGSQLGIPVRQVAEDLQRASGFALSFQEALRQASSITAFGFTSDQAEELALVARRASVALGVDFTDALNRVQRGVSRLEPELLDELGVTVRLSEAYERRAQLLGVTANELSANQRQIAFLNGVLEQSEQRFGQIDPFLEPTYWERAGAAISQNVNQALQGTARILENLAVNVFGEFNEQVRDSTQNTRQLAESLLLATTPSAQATAVLNIERERTNLLREQAEIQGALSTTPQRVNVNVAGRGNAEVANVEFGRLQGRLRDVNEAIRRFDGLLNTANLALNVTTGNAESVRAAFTDVTSGLEDLDTSLERVQSSLAVGSNIYETTANQLRGVETALTRLSGAARTSALTSISDALGTSNVSSLRRNFQAVAATTREYQSLNRQALLLQLSGQSDLAINQRKQVIIENQINALSRLEGSSGRIAQLETQLLSLRVQARDVALQEAEAIAQQGRDRQNQLNAEARARQDAFLGQAGQRSNIGVEGEELQQQNILTAANNFNTALSQLTAQNDGLETLFTNINAISASFNNLGETSLNATQLTTVGLNAFSGLLQNVSSQAVSSIDAQIQAERRRDGQSQQSVARIRALEAQKIREQKRAAQQSIIISTAVAVMNAAANPWPVPALPLMAAAALAGGLALSQASSAASNQLGSLNTGATQQAASLSVGNRDNRVNVQSQASSGELSFIRGETGTGNINSFTPRAAGGIGTPGLGLLVGENGPELVTPTQDVTITDAEDTEAMMNGSGRGGNFALTINALDAQSFMDRGADIFEAFNSEAQQRGIDLQRIG